MDLKPKSIKILDQFCSSLELPFYPTSSLTNEGMKELFDSIKLYPSLPPSKDIYI